MRLQTDEDWAALHLVYWTLGLSLQDLGEMTHYHRVHISRRFKALGLPVRPRFWRAAA